MAILINDNYSLQACKPFDARYLNICTPWTSVSAVNIAIPTYRYTGLTVNIQGTEYWYKDGIADSCLIPKSLGGTLTGATNGLHLVNSGTSVALGGALVGSGATVISLNAIGGNFIVSGGTASNCPYGLSVLSYNGEQVLPRVTIGALSQGYNLNAMLVDEGGMMWNMGCISGIRSCGNLSSNGSIVFTSQKGSGTTSFGTFGSNLDCVRLYTGSGGSTCRRTEITLCGGKIKVCGCNSATGFAGIEYCYNYSSGFTSRSLVDVAYVTGKTSTISIPITGATNGLSITGKKVKLGGNLTGTTTINTVNNEFRINNSIIPNQCFLMSSSGAVSIYGVSGPSYCSRGVWDGDIELRSECLFCDATIKICGSTSSIQMTVGDGLTHPISYFNPSGLTYNTNFASCNTSNPRWIPDAAYVNSKISGSSNIANVCNVSVQYTATTSSSFIGVSGASCIYLMIAPNCGQRVSVADICGGALSNPITINGNGKRINDGSCTCSLINTAYGSITFIYNGHFWSAVAFTN